MKIAEGKMDEFLQACAEVRPHVLREPGCIAYEYTRDVQSPLGRQETPDPNRVTLIEQWESMDALAGHGGGTEHMKVFAARVKDLREQVTIRVTEPIFEA